MKVSDVQGVVAAAIGGDNIGETVEGLQRFPINVRYPREIRDSVEKIRNLPIVTERGAQIPLSAVSGVRKTPAPPRLRKEEARLARSGVLGVFSRALGPTRARKSRYAAPRPASVSRA